jgi:hypothetical protein
MLGFSFILNSHHGTMRHYPSICLDGLRKSTKDLSIISVIFMLNCWPNCPSVSGKDEKEGEHQLSQWNLTVDNMTEKG